MPGEGGPARADVEDERMHDEAREARAQAPRSPAKATTGTTLRDALASVGTALLLLLAVSGPFVAATFLFGVSFLSPVGFLLIGLAVPLLLLWMLRARRPTRAIGSVLFWKAVALEQQATSPFKRLRRSLVLLLELVALVALAYGLARPIVLGEGKDGVARVLVIDTSASMLARDVGGGTRLDSAKAAARALVGALGARDRATVIAADRSAWTVVPWTDDATALARGIDDLAARHTGTALDEGLILAASAAHDAAGALEVHLFSDGAAPALTPVGLGSALRFHSIGSTGDNLGIIQVALRPRVKGAGGAAPGTGEGEAWEVFVTVRNAGQSDRALLVSLERDGTAVAALPVVVGANADKAVVLAARLAPGPVVARLRTPEGRAEGLDVLPVDDAAYALVPAELGVPVGLATTGDSPALRRALEAAGAQLRPLPGGAAWAGAGPVTALDDPDLRLCVFEGLLPAELPPRDCLLVAPPSAVGPVRPGAPAGGVRIAGWDTDDPLLRWVDLDDVQVSTTRRLDLGAGARALVHAQVMVDPDGAGGVAPVRSTTPLLAAWQDGTASRVVLGFDLYRSTWPLRASFPIFIRNLVLAAGQRDALARGGLRAGEPLAVPVPAGLGAVEVTLPDGRVVVARAQDGQAVVADTDQVGIYEVRAGSRRERFCVNLGAPEESRIAPRAALDLGDAQVAAEVAPTARTAEVSPWLALVALIALTLELWAFHRRW